MSPAAAPAGGDVAFLPAAPLPISRTTPFRATGDVPLSTWEAAFAGAGSTIKGATLRDMHAAARGVTALVLDRYRIESHYATSQTGRNNHLGLRIPGSLEFQDFASPVDCTRELIRRWTDSTYKNRVYMPRELSLAGMLERYSPPHENDTEALIAAAVANVNRWRQAAGEDVSEQPALNFGPHPLPSGFEIRPATKREGSSGRGWRQVGTPRGPRLLVLFWHHTAGGVGFTKDECWKLFSIGGQREYQALTEAVADRDGTGYIMNDPWSTDPLEGSGRSPFASGPYDKSGSLLAPFVQRYGADAINELGWATEHCHAEGEKWGDKLLDGSARLHGWVITRMQIPYPEFPKNPRMGNLWASFDHDDAAFTTCPNMPADVRKALVEAVRFEAKKLQTGGFSPPPPPPDPEPAEWPLALGRDEVADFWGHEGGLRRYAADGSVKVYPFDPEGPIAAMWMARARQSGIFPAALDWWVDEGGWTFVTFGSEGDTDWVLALPSTDGRGDWRWVDDPSPDQS